MKTFLPIRQVKITDPTLVSLARLVKAQVLPYQWEILNDRVPGAEPSHCIRNFRIAAGEVEGAHGGAVFQDTDVAKWLEAVAYSLMLFPDPALESLADDVIALIGRAQQPDGYLNTYYTIVQPEGRWCNLMEGHELYTAGHMIEAAVAYHQATGKKRFLEIVCRMADNIMHVFGAEEGKRRGYPGHPEIELALVRLYQETHEEKYLVLSTYFLNARGVGENIFEIERQAPGHQYIFPEMAGFFADYFQSHLPVREQRTATGHAVRAMYLYSAMADIAALSKDDAMAEACRCLFDNVTRRQIYLTGGIGPAALGERFTTDYDLPNDSAYAESCASIGLMMLARRMFVLTGQGGTYDIWERALYNTVLAGMGQDGRHFFYTNPLEAMPGHLAANPGLRHIKPVRQAWYGVACCPPNIARTITALSGSLFAWEDDTLFVMTSIAASLSTMGRSASVTRHDVEGGEYTLNISGPACRIALRVPASQSLYMDGKKMLPSQNGFLLLSHAGGESTFSYTLVARPHLVRAHPKVSQNAGMAAIMEDSIVYCLEGIDHGGNLSGIHLDPAPSFERVMLPWLPAGMHALKLNGWRMREDAWEDELYTDQVPIFEKCELTAIPYSQWNNRGAGEMRVWLPLAQACPGI